MIQESFKAPIEVVQEYQKKLEYKLVANERIRRGHMIFEFNFETGELVNIIPEKEDVTVVTNTYLDFLPMHGVGTPIEKTTKRIKILRKPHCLYFSRLNFRSAFKYLEKLMPGIEFTKIT